MRLNMIPSNLVLYALLTSSGIVAAPMASWRGSTGLCRFFCVPVTNLTREILQGKVTPRARHTPPGR